MAFIEHLAAFFSDGAIDYPSSEINHPIPPVTKIKTATSPFITQREFLSKHPDLDPRGVCSELTNAFARGLLTGTGTMFLNNEQQTYEAVKKESAIQIQLEQQNHASRHSAFTSRGIPHTDTILSTEELKDETQFNAALPNDKLNLFSYPTSRQHGHLVFFGNIGNEAKPDQCVFFDANKSGRRMGPCSDVKRLLYLSWLSEVSEGDCIIGSADPAASPSPLLPKFC